MFAILLLGASCPLLADYAARVDLKNVSDGVKTNWPVVRGKNYVRPRIAGR